MSKVVHLSDHAHNKAKAYCQTRGLKMSEWVASLIDRATDDTLDVGPMPTPQLSAGAMGEASPGKSARDSGSLRSAPVASAVDHHEGSSYQALVQKKKLTQAVPSVQSLPDGSTPIYEAPPFWAR